MLISRKKFLKISGGAVAGAALSNLWMPNLLKAASVKDGKGRLPIIWFQGQACTGCPVSLLNTEYPGNSSQVDKKPDGKMGDWPAFWVCPHFSRVIPPPH